MNSPNQPVLRQSEDEISLIDLWLILTRHKWLMTGVFLLSIAAALAIAIIKKPKYSYSSSIEIGSIVEQDGKGDGRLLIDNPATLLAKIKNGYIPQVWQEFSRDQAGAVEVTARVPKGSSLIVLEAKATVGEGETVKQFERRIIDLVRADHARILDVAKTDITTELSNEQRHLDEHMDIQKLITAKLEHNKVLTTLLRRQIKDATAQIADIVANRRDARTMNGNEAKAMTLLMLDNEIEQNRQWVAELEERLQIQIPSDNDSLNKDLADTLRNQESIRAKIEQLEVRLKNVQETRAIIEPTQSHNPVGPGKATIVVLGVVLGGFLALFSAFLSEMIVKVRKAIVTNETS